MSEPKFKPGMKAWSARFGAVTLERHNPHGGVCHQTPEGLEDYHDDGRWGSKDLQPSLYTLEEAKRMGFPVPEEPRVIWVNFYPNNVFACWLSKEDAETGFGPSNSERIGPARKFVEVIE